MYHIISQKAYEDLQLHKSNSLNKSQFEFLIASKEEIKSWFTILQQGVRASLWNGEYRAKESEAYAIIDFITLAKWELDSLEVKVNQALAVYNEKQKEK
jgi:hypothetical protein